MELQWNLCPFCGNQHVDLYHPGPPLVGDELLEAPTVAFQAPTAAAVESLTNHKDGREELEETAEPDATESAKPDQ
jgi:hypothetical protein